MKGRGSGILLHLTSLPSPFGIGDMGPWAYRFADFLAEARQHYWQILPLNPTDLKHGNSPYHSASAFACNPLLISPELLVRDGLLLQEEVDALGIFPEGRVDYANVVVSRGRLLNRAIERFKEAPEISQYERFRVENTRWLDDFSLFMALKFHFKGKPWSRWPHDIRDRKPEALQSAKKAFHERIEKEAIQQYLFFKQWHALKDYCNKKGIQIIGDMPIYVIHDGADVWVHPELFKLDDEKEPCAVAGVPPDYFSETGQLWGNPVYRWDVLTEKGYSWWIQRIAHNLRLFDLTRLDHFRGFVAYWEVPAHERTAVKGRWIAAPARDFFDQLTKAFPSLSIIAEDLGIITPDVKEVIDHYQFPCMKVLLFAFGQDLPGNPYAPHNYTKNCVVYTGTHDNNTARGWFEMETTPEERERLSSYLGRKVSGERVHRELVRLAMMSVANTAIFPMQDILGLKEESRMNRPATRDGNWQWRLLPDQLSPLVAKSLLAMTEIYGRA